MEGWRLDLRDQKRGRESLIFGECSTITGADLRITRQEQGESTRDPLNNPELAPNSANGSIPSLIAWIVPKPPSNAATVSDLAGIFLTRVIRSIRMSSAPESEGSHLGNPS